MTTSGPDIETQICPPESHSTFPFSFLFFLAEAAITIIREWVGLQENWCNESLRTILKGGGHRQSGKEPIGDNFKQCYYNQLSSMDRRSNKQVVQWKGVVMEVWKIAICRSILVGLSCLSLCGFCRYFCRDDGNYSAFTLPLNIWCLTKILYNYSKPMMNKVFFIILIQLYLFNFVTL